MKRVIPLTAMLLVLVGCNSANEAQVTRQQNSEDAIQPQIQSDERPNIIVFLADDAGFVDFGFMGSEDMQTPNLDALAEQGVRFTDAHVSGSVCSPSRAGLLTGRYQQRFGHENNSPPKGKGMDPSEVTIATLLQENGYTTAAFGKWHVGDDDIAHHPNQRGFDHFYGFLGGHRSYFPSPKYDKPGTHTAMQLNGEYTHFDGYLTYDLGNKAIDFIDTNKDDPFFIYLSYNAVHTPMHATEEDLALFEGHPRQTLAAMTWAMDKSIGQVIDKLKQEGIYDNTLIFFLSDNGGPTPSNGASNGPLKASKGYEFEGGHRVPFVMTWAGELPAGITKEGLTSSMDIFPTAMKAAGITATTGKPLDGVDLLPYATGESHLAPHNELYWRIGPWAAARMDNYKLVYAKGVDTALYDLATDLGENSNVKQQQSTKHEEVMQRYLSWESTLVDPLWPGSQSWKQYKTYMYRDYIDGNQPRFNSMREFNQYLRTHPTEY